MVEEYKRPKFQVTMEAPTTAAKLNQKGSLPGKAWPTPARRLMERR